MVGAHEMRPKKAGVFHTPLQDQLKVRSNLGAECDVMSVEF